MVIKPRINYKDFVAKLHTICFDSSSRIERFDDYSDNAKYMNKLAILDDCFPGFLFYIETVERFTDKEVHVMRFGIQDDVYSQIRPHFEIIDEA